MVRRLPVLSQVESWVEQAKGLPPVINLLGENKTVDYNQ